MAAAVTQIDIELPDAHARAAQAHARTLPQAKIVLLADGDAERTLYAPPRVARVLEAEQPDLPAPASTVHSHIDALAARMCFTVLIEMLSRRDHSRREAMDKLRRAGYTEAQASSAIQKAESYRYLQDDRFAAQFIEQRKARGWGKIKIEAELRRRGIEASSLEGYPDAFFSADDDLERAVRILRNKSIPSTRPVERLARHLMNKGFSSHMSFEAARKRVEGSPDFD